MGYGNENSDAIVLDLETVARDGIEAILDPVAAPANYKDADVIEAFKRGKALAQVERAALDVNLCRIITLGIYITPANIPIKTFHSETDEAEGLRQLASVIDLTGRGGVRRIITFNGLHFDLLVLQQRARILGVRFPTIDVGAPWRNPNTDLMQVLTFNGATAKHSLDFYCRVFGIDIEVPDDVRAVTGADVGRLANEGRFDLIEGHNRYDLLRTAALAKRVGAMQ